MVVMNDIISVVRWPAYSGHYVTLFLRSRYYTGRVLIVQIQPETQMLLTLD